MEQMDRQTNGQTRCRVPLRVKAQQCYKLSKITYQMNNYYM